ncbi:type I-MYXAN CRISPR-associated protein Cas5/Cmx5/DevS [Crocosphaera sp.]|uniref:type I-MYXAN CRISPR-associated protein Cas5/Cmx5/DevS n=1 Tax=Crocosphaera sp. TaxID=2729996 RepID=UPI003F25E91A|nr:type I-MYXAN CRISPR-associated protein Cas5/Cmx5/DevS [Crocosphaera sp.]
MKSIAIYIDVPVATFRQSHAREYGKTYPYPPHSTVYGLLLSLAGEMNMQKHCGVQLAIAMLSQPEKSKTLRTLHRFKFKEEDHQSNKRPDYQEILTDIRFIVWVKSAEDKHKPTLTERLEQALLNPDSVNRWGVLYLGESDDLVNIIKLVPDDFSVQSRQWLIQDNNGWITLPYWVDHFGFKGTHWLRYRLEAIPCSSPPDLAWTTIQD